MARLKRGERQSAVKVTLEGRGMQAWRLGMESQAWQIVLRAPADKVALGKVYVLMQSTLHVFTR